MAVGDEAKVGLDSYLSIAKESTFGTYVTGTTAYEFNSSSIKTEQASRVLESMFKSRARIKRVLLERNTVGTIEGDLHPQDAILLIANAMGGPITSSSLTAGAFTHSISAGGMNTTTAVKSLSITERKGDSNMFAYVGGRVNSLKLAATVGEVAKLSADMVFKDGTSTANDIATSLSVSAALPFVFIDGSYRYGGAEDSLTSVETEKIQAFELTINNNLKPEEGRELGSAVPSLIPPTTRMVELKITQRFDTTTVLDRHLSATQGSVQLRFDGDSITAEANYSLVMTMPRVFQNGGGDPELSGRDEIIKMETSFDVVTDDPNTTTGKDIAMTFVNTQASL